MAVSTELALRQAAFFITTVSLTTSLQPNKWSFIVCLCEVLPLFLLRSTKLLARAVLNLYIYWEKGLRKTDHNHFEVGFFFASGFRHLHM